jgi:hypothetical protein
MTLLEEAYKWGNRELSEGDEGDEEGDDYEGTRLIVLILRGRTTTGGRREDGDGDEGKGEGVRASARVGNEVKASDSL